MPALETVAGIRNDHFRDKVPIKAIARKRRVSRNTVRKAVREGPEAFGSAAGKRQPKPKLGPWIGDLERMLAERAALPRRERPTLTRIHEDPASLGCGAGYDSVRRHAAAWRERQAAEAPREAHVPLAFDPGEAFQFDWSAETAALGGTPVKAGRRTSAFATAGWRSFSPAAGRAWDARGRAQPGVRVLRRLLPARDP